MGKGYPQTQLDDIEPSAVQEIVSSLKELHDKGKPQSDEELEQRIDDYFAFCEKSSIRPGIESLALSLHIVAVGKQRRFNRRRLLLRHLSSKVCCRAKFHRRAEFFLPRTG